MDTAITSPYQFSSRLSLSKRRRRYSAADWHTQSHASLLGTGRSAHYTVLVDDSKFSADILQQLVFNLFVLLLSRALVPSFTLRTRRSRMLAALAASRFRLTFLPSRRIQLICLSQYATPAYYANRVCTRAQLILKRDDDDVRGKTDRFQSLFPSASQTSP